MVSKLLLMKSINPPRAMNQYQQGHQSVPESFLLLPELALQVQRGLPRRPRKRGSPTRTPRPVSRPFLWSVAGARRGPRSAGSGGRLFLYLALKIYPAGSPGPLHTLLSCTAWRPVRVVDRLVVARPCSRSVSCGRSATLVGIYCQDLLWHLSDLFY